MYAIRNIFLLAELDLFVMLASFVCCLFWALEYGIVVGVFIQILIILYHAARPKIEVHQKQVCDHAFFIAGKK